MAKVALDLASDIHPVSDFRANTASLLKQIKESGRPLVLTQRGRGSAVVLDIQAYQDMLEELETLRDIHAALGDVKAGRVLSHGEAKERLLSRYR